MNITKKLFDFKKGYRVDISYDPEVNVFYTNDSDVGYFENENILELIKSIDNEVKSYGE